MRPIVLAAAALLLVGCGLASEGPAPGALGYGVPTPNPAAYTFSDTAVFTIESALGPMRVVTAQAGAAELDFRRWPDDRSVVIRIPRWRGTFSNDTQGEVHADESEIDGVFTVRLEPDGRMTVVDTPSLSDAVLDIAGPEGLIRPLFVRLPGRPLEPGARWVDTVTSVEEVGGTRSVTRSEITSTLQGDTAVAGRRFLLIRTRAENTVEVTGVSGGVEIAQRLEGTSIETVLWDDDADLLVERVTYGTLVGTLELPGVAVEPMPVRAETWRTVSLR